MIVLKCNSHEMLFACVYSKDSPSHKLYQQLPDNKMFAAFLMLLLVLPIFLKYLSLHCINYSLIYYNVLFLTAKDNNK